MISTCRSPRERIPDCRYHVLLSIVLMDSNACRGVGSNLDWCRLAAWVVSRGRYAGRRGQSFHPQFRRSIHHQLRRLYRRHAHYLDRRRRGDRILLVGGKLQMGQVDHEKGYWLRERRGWNLIGCFYTFNQYSGVARDLRRLTYEPIQHNASNEQSLPASSPT